MKFFEEYKAVDILCCDIFNAHQGVTTYISEMERLDFQGSRKVNNWDAKYKMLKHLRWIRNQIAHSESVPNLDKSDLTELERFHKLLLNQKDPLSELRKATKSEPKKSRHAINQTAKSNASFSSAALIIILGCVIVLMLSAAIFALNNLWIN